nr:hypothetical protein [Mycoplasmopsis anatis]
MLNIKFILENEEKVRSGLLKRGFEIEIFDEAISLAKDRGQTMFASQQKKAELSKFSQQFSEFKSDKEKLNNCKKKLRKLKKNNLILKKKQKILTKD